MKTAIMLISLLIITATNLLHSQDFVSGGNVSGNFQFEGQLYQEDKSIGAEDFREKFGTNSFINLIYNSSNLEFGLRYEAYLPPMSGFDNQYEGNGIPYRYARYKSNLLDITVGNFYEQFGSGIIFRSYEEKTIGIDNSIDGIKIKLYPTEGIELTGLIGKQRTFWNISDNLIRAADMNLSINELFENVIPDHLYLTLGASVVSRFQKDNDPSMKLPENVLAYSTRMNLAGESLSFDAEYAYKHNDPNITNDLTYHPGQGIILSGSYFTKGLGIILNTHWIDNMDFRSDRTITGNMQTLNYIPALTKQQGYSLTTLYPFATQFNGEAGVQAEIAYKIPKKTALGGRFGTSITLNGSVVYDIIRSNEVFNEDLGLIVDYDSEFFGFGDNKFYSDINFEISRRWSKEFKQNLTYLYNDYDRDVIEGESGNNFGMVRNNAIILETTYRLSDDHAIRSEFQYLRSKQQLKAKADDKKNGDWAMLLLEYTIAPSFFISVYDEYNLGNANEEYQLHYYGVQFAYVYETSRIAVGYARQKEGLLCVGGICRNVPAYRGFAVSVSSTF